MPDAQPTPLYLASGSPRRAQLLNDRGFAFEQVDPPFDDTGVMLDAAAPHRAAEALAFLKAASAVDVLDAGIAIACDTIVVQAGYAFGKPEDRRDAREMLHLLIGVPHEVVTAVAIMAVDDERLTLFHDRARVTIGEVPHRELEAYLNAGGWVGKAGGYNLGELEHRWPFEVEGDPTTVIGLPMDKLADRLRRFAAEPTEPQGRSAG